MTCSIHIDRRPSHLHVFKRSGVRPGAEHPNRSKKRSPVEMIVRISAFVGFQADLTTGEGEKKRTFLSSQDVVKIRCVVDTGATCTIFQGGIAKKLSLNPNDNVDNCSCDLVDGGNHVFMTSIHDVFLEIGLSAISVPVRFRVKRVQERGYQWFDAPKGENILGMESVLSQRMLCFTPDSLFAFELE